MPVIELPWHNEWRDIFWLWDDYSWSAEAFEGMEYETDGGEGVSGNSPGIGAAINCLLPLVNVDDMGLEMSNAGLHRSKDPGSGAITPYHNRRTTAYTDIPAGMELFISYGEGYFSSRSEVYGPMPFDRHYRQADKVLRKYLRLKQRYLKDAPVALLEDLWNLIVNNSYAGHSRGLAALPSHHERVEAVVEVGTAQQYFNRSIQTLEWLEENGKCIDNIQPGLSKIPQAGRGAFASRPIPKNGLVTSAPLIHIPNRSLLTMYEATEDETHIIADTSKPVHQQLMLNYCFGHAKSSVLLSPYGSWTNLINHSLKPNTRIAWADDMAHPEWLNLPTELLEQQEHAGLMFDYIALRDIEEGEEITIDYGDEWQAAWDEHVRNWKPPKNANEYQAAYELNEDVDLVIRTIREPSYSENLRLFVREEYRLMAGLEETETEWYNALILDRYEYKGETRYMAQLFVVDDDDETEMSYMATDDGNNIADERPEILFSVPRDAFAFDDVPYSRDHAMQTAFRHDMRVPDDMFPPAWKDLGRLESRLGSYS